jgi:hypothetical protein
MRFSIHNGSIQSYNNMFCVRCYVCALLLAAVMMQRKNTTARIDMIDGYDICRMLLLVVVCDWCAFFECVFFMLMLPLLLPIHTDPTEVTARPLFAASAPNKNTDMLWII